MKVLLVEDDMQAAAFLSKGLMDSGYSVDQEYRGDKGLQLAMTDEYDILIVDRMLPELDGLELIKACRAAGRSTPVLILSARGEVDDRVSGLKAGGDDYLIKPYAFSELLARLEALLRRGQVREAGEILVVADLELDRIRHRVTRRGIPILLQPREFRLLDYLMRYAGQVVTRNMLLEQVWGYHFDPQTNVIDVHISRLRGKIDRNFSQPLLHTVRGAGYVLTDAQP